MIKITRPGASFDIALPTSTRELTPSIFNAITSDVKLPKNYCIVALCCKTRLFDIAASIKSNRDATVPVIPIMAKISKEDSERINTAVGDKIIINRSSLERGNHINLVTVATINNVQNYISENKEFLKSILSNPDYVIGEDLDIKEPIKIKDVPNVIVMEFKIVPINDITAAIDKAIEVIDPFKIANETC